MPEIMLAQSSLSCGNQLRDLSQRLDMDEQHLYHFFDCSPDLLAIVDVNGDFIRANKSWPKILGSDCLVGRNLLDLVCPEDVPEMSRILTDLVDQDEQNFRCRLIGKNGKLITVEFSATQWAWGQSNLIGRVCKPDVDWSSNVDGDR